MRSHVIYDIGRLPPATQAIIFLRSSALEQAKSFQIHLYDIHHISVSTDKRLIFCGHNILLWHVCSLSLATQLFRAHRTLFR